MSELTQLLEFLSTDKLASADRILSAVGKAAQNFGFMYAHYNFCQKTSHSKTCNNFLPNAYTYPEEWVDRYYEADHYINDPTVRYAVQTCLPYSWHDMHKSFPLNSDQQLVFDEASEFGLKQGLSIPILNPGEGTSLLCFSGDLSQKDFHQICSHFKTEFALIGIYLANICASQKVENVPAP